MGLSSKDISDERFTGMNRLERLWFVPVLVVALIGLFGWNAQGQKQQSTGRPQWEYKVVNLYQDNAEKILNELGSEGWEIVAVQSGNDATAKGLYHFKRQKQ